MGCSCMPSSNPYGLSVAIVTIDLYIVIEIMLEWIATEEKYKYS